MRDALASKAASRCPVRNGWSKQCRFDVESVLFFQNDIESTSFRPAFSHWVFPSKAHDDRVAYGCLPPRLSGALTQKPSVYPCGYTLRTPHARGRVLISKYAHKTIAHGARCTVQAAQPSVYPCGYNTTHTKKEPLPQPKRNFSKLFSQSYFILESPITLSLFFIFFLNLPLFYTRL
jgi:hypothetical protein